MRSFDYLAPATLAEASAAKAQHGASARVLAGGTDLTVGLRHGTITADVVIDLKRVAELAPDISRNGTALRVSAGTTMSTLHRYLVDAGLFPALQDAAAVVGSIQIRNRATLAGNVCNASPAADTVPVLAALGASVEISDATSTRSRAIADFIEGNRKIDLGPGELVSAVIIPLPEGPHGTAFDRITRRRGVDLATTNMCCTLDAAGVAVFAFGAVSPRPLVLRDASGTLADAGTDAASRADLIRELAARATPISDVRASAEYRSAMLCVMAERALAVARGRLAEVMAHA